MTASTIRVKRCGRCKQTLPISNFQKNRDNADGYQASCKSCRNVERELYKDKINKYHREWTKKHGVTGHVSKTSSAYLGVVIAEGVLSRYFEDVERMPYGNPGFDFICKRGFKIDVKSACLLKGGNEKVGHWRFNINRNKTADYFLFLAFDDRTSLKPEHMWLVPGGDVNKRDSIYITCSQKVLEMWKKYEKPIEKIALCCERMKAMA